MGETFFWELATLIDIMLFGHWIQMRSILGASRALERSWSRSCPRKPNAIKDGQTVDVKVESLKLGDRVLVKPGGRDSIDGTVIEGETSANESMLKGESRQIRKRAGDDVIRRVHQWRGLDLDRS